MASSLVSTSVCFGLAFIFLCLRLYARAILVATGLEVDDYLLVASFVSRETSPHYCSLVDRKSTLT